MSKNKPPHNPIPTPRPPATPDVDVDLPPPIIVELVQVDVDLLSQCQVGESVTIRWQEDPVPVNVLSGIRLGNVSPDDTAKVKQRKSSIGHIAVREVENGRCMVEV